MPDDRLERTRRAYDDEDPAAIGVRFVEEFAAAFFAGVTAHPLRLVLATEELLAASTQDPLEPDNDHLWGV